MLVNVLIAVAVLVGVVLLIAAVSSDAFRIERKLLMQAPAEKVFALIEDFHQWSSWSPWESLDPNLKRTHSGAAKGVGAIY
ncbi:MAG TPA: hypothetical protein VHM25_22545, partial [Polyangiaceae bacterium]|nr:hypothetical protein [Polyangiaceae bacterium]